LTNGASILYDNLSPNVIAIELYLMTIINSLLIYNFLNTKETLLFVSERPVLKKVSTSGPRTTSQLEYSPDASGISTDTDLKDFHSTVKNGYEKEDHTRDLQLNETAGTEEDTREATDTSPACTAEHDSGNTLTDEAQKQHNTVGEDLDRGKKDHIVAQELEEEEDFTSTA